MAKNTEKALFKNLELMTSYSLSDELYAVAFNIEQTLLSTGAIPGKDYNYLDLVKLAQPFVLELIRSKDKIISYPYPADEVIKQ